MTEKVPYALKIETSESCLTLSARYGDEAGGTARVGKGTEFQVGKWNDRCWVFLQL